MTRFASPVSRRGPTTEAAQERKITDMCYHIRDLRRRNDLLQRSLDEANAVIAMMQAEALDVALPLPTKISPTEQLRRKSVAVRRLLANRMEAK